MSDGRVSELSFVAQAFQPAGFGDFPVPSSEGACGTRNWKVPGTRRLESPRYGDRPSTRCGQPTTRRCAPRHGKLEVSLDIGDSFG